MRQLISLFSMILFISFLNAAPFRAARCSQVYFNKDARSFFNQFTFSASEFFPLFSQATADLNNDGNLDLVVGIMSSGTPKLITFFGDGQGRFVPGSMTNVRTNQPLGGFKIRLIDINNDSVLDMATFSSGILDVYFGNNNGGFTFQGMSHIFAIFGVGSPDLIDIFDINSDGRKDILVTHVGPKSGTHFVYYHLASENYTYPNSGGIQVFTGARSLLVEDFNNDGRKDIAATFPGAATNSFVLRFYYNQGNGAFTASPNIDIGNTERLRLAHDFDGNGTKDFVAMPFNANSEIAVLYNNANQSFSIVKYPTLANFNERTFNLNDFDGDGIKDFAAFSPNGYDIYLRKRVGGFTRSSQNIAPNSSFFSSIADFNNDRAADILRFGSNGIFHSIFFQLYEAECFRRGRPDTIDYIGNERQNFATWQPETGRWTYTDAIFPQTSFSVFFGSGALGDIPVPGDYDGDGVTDPAVFRQSTGTWLANTTKQGTISFPFGISGDKPVPADYDGDFKTDFAVFRPATHDWMIWQSSTQSSLLINFGLSEDKPVPADFDGDRKADVAVFRPSDGTWHYLKSSDNSSIVSVQFGQAGDIPQPTDVDGDGRADFNLFRPASAVFYFASSFDGRNSFVSRGQGGIPQPSSGFFINNFYTYRPSDGAWFRDSVNPLTQTPPYEIPVSYVLPVGN